MSKSVAVQLTNHPIDVKSKFAVTPNSDCKIIIRTSYPLKTYGNVCNGIESETKIYEYDLYEPRIFLHVKYCFAVASKVTNI